MVRKGRLYRENKRGTMRKKTLFLKTIMKIIEPLYGEKFGVLNVLCRDEGQPRPLPTEEESRSVYQLANTCNIIFQQLSTIHVLPISTPHRTVSIFVRSSQVAAHRASVLAV